MRCSSLYRAARATKQSLTFWLVALTTTSVLAILMLGLLLVWESKHEAERQADDVANNLTTAISRDIERNFEIFDLSLQGVVDSLEQPGFSSLHGRIRQLALFGRAAEASYLNSILVVDDKGNVLDNSHSVEPMKLNLSDRDFFKKQRDDPTLGMYLGPPIKGRLEGDWLISISRRLSRPDGSFAGLVVGTVRLDYFQYVFENLNIGPNGFQPLEPLQALSLGDLGRLRLGQYRRQNRSQVQFP
jgi:hypothetical protein